MKRELVILAEAGFGLCHAGAALMPIEWSADGSEPKPFVASIAQGETRDLEVTLKNYGQAVALPAEATAELHYQTNGMGRSWWSGGAASVTTAGVLRATWTPALDCGASSYTFAIGVVDGTNKLYTAYGLIRMRVSPGWVPNELAQPWRTLDFETLTIQHPPWATTNDIDAAIAAILEDDPIALPVAQAAYTAASNAQAAAAAKVPLTRTVNGKALSANITLSPADIGAVPMVDNVGVAPSFQAGGGMITGSSYLHPYALIIGDGVSDFVERIQIDDVGITMPGWFRLLWPTTNNYLTPSPIATLADISTATVAIEEGVTNAAHNVATTLIGHPYVLQGSTVVPATNAVLSVTGVATNAGGGVINIMPYLASRPDQNGSTGTLHIATAPDTYIVDIDADIAVSTPDYGATPQTWFPVEWRSERTSETNWTVYAWAPGQTATYASKDGYYATLSNLVVYTYDRPGYRPGTLTNDTAAIPSYTDTADLTRADARRIPTAAGVRDYVTARKREIAASAWRLTPAGRDAPSADFVTIDLPLVQQGQMAFLQSGDYFVMSYEGGDWRSTTVGSMWTIGASGRSDLTITAEARMAFIRDFSVVGETATIYAATNWMGGAASTNGVPSGADPYVEFTQSLSNPQWLACPQCTRAYFVDAVNGDYWRFIAPATAQTMFYRVQIPGGDRRIIAAPRLRLMNGLEVVNGATNQLDLITITNGTEVIKLMGVRL